MTESFSIERTSDAHIEGLWSVLAAVAQERRYLATVDGFSLPQVRAFARDIVSDGGVQFVAIDGGVVVGWCDVRRSPYEGFRHVGVLGIGLAANRRDKGIGPRLLARTIEAASEAGVRRVELEVFASNSRAVHVFERSGFVREGLKRRARVLDGREDDVVCMALFV
jgi:RimJ/RimL family protein N-acetyltransferase